MSSPSEGSARVPRSRVREREARTEPEGQRPPPRPEPETPLDLSIERIEIEGVLKEGFTGQEM
jgi:hypothetical protein